MRIRHLIAIVAGAPVLLQSVPAQAAQALPPGQKQGPYVRWYYPGQLSYGTVEPGAGEAGWGPASTALLTLPFMGPHIVTSLFDHCYPDYGVNGRICRYDGQVATQSTGGPDPGFSEGYAQSPGGHDYLYYDGHDGYDYALTYEPVAAAAPGIVKSAGWIVPDCHTRLSELTVEINPRNAMQSFYGHLSRIDVGQRQPRQRAQERGTRAL